MLLTKDWAMCMQCRTFLPNGLRGLLLVAFLAAYLSTISTQLNMGASFIVNDLYIPFFSKKKEDGLEEDPVKIIQISRLATLALMLIGLFVTTQINSISGVWEFYYGSRSWAWSSVNLKMVLVAY